MCKSLIKGAAVGALIVFLWMFISWKFVPWHCSVMHSFSNGDQIRSLILENTSEDGMYMLPNICQKNGTQKRIQAMRQGPVIFAAVQRYGLDVDTAIPYIISFVIQIIGAGLVTLLLLLTKLETYWKRVGFVTLLGFTIGFLGSIYNWIWWGFSFGFVGLELMDATVAWFLAGLAISNFIKEN